MLSFSSIKLFHVITYDKDLFCKFRYLRSVAYREFTQLVHGYLGNKRIPLPACAYHAIRTRFVGKDFQGYDDEEFEDK